MIARRVEGVSEVRAFAAVRRSGEAKRLWLAYTPKTLAAERLKSAIHAHLPASMRPHDYLALDALPTLSNGKVSEQKLIDRLVATELDTQEVQFSATSNGVKDELLSMINALLGEDKATENNSAVRCGLDSIDAMKLTAQLRERFDIDLRLASVLESRNWGELASHIETLLNTNNSTGKHAAPSQDNHWLPLSAQQLPLWFLDQTGIQPEVYAVHSTLRCTGTLLSAAVEYALNALIHRNEILRTRYRISEAGDTCQVVLAPEPVICTSVDQSDSGITWEQARDKQLMQRFDLANDQLLRALVFRSRDDEHILMLHSHHIAMDGWSFDVLHAQFAEYYHHYCDATNAAGLANQIATVDMPEPDKYQYSDFIHWQKNANPQVLLSDTEHWCRVLAEPRESLDLPLDFQRPARPSHKGRSVVRLLDQNTTQCWTQLAHETHSTPFMVALGAVKSGLRAVLGVSDLLIGTPVSNRVEPRWQNMLGFFSNTVVLRTKSRDSDTLVDSVVQTRAVTLDALQHESVAFDLIVRSLNLQGSTSRNPLFDIYFMYKHQHESLPELPNLNLELVNQEMLDTAKFDLAIEIRPASHTQENDYELHLNYSVDLFHESTVDRLADELLSAMSAMAQQSNKPIISVLPLVDLAPGSAEPLQLATEPMPISDNGLLIHQRLDQVFHSRCLKEPASVALRHDECSINYQELDQLVDRITNCLNQSGVEPGDVVAVSLPRSIPQIAAALAVSRCEAVWCPIDPEYPVARKHYMLLDSHARCIISDSDVTDEKAPLAELLQIVVEPAVSPERFEPRVLNAQAVDTKDRQPDKSDISATHYRRNSKAAVLMYTSGSMGNPKGVLLSHRAIVNRFVWMWNQYPFDTDDVNVIKTSCSFVDSLWESFGALLGGVPSVLIKDSGVSDVASFLHALRSNKVTRVLVVPSLLSTMLDWLITHNEHLPDLKLCSCSGEVLSTQLASRFLEKLPHTRLLNLYGSTEVAADVTCQEIVPGQTLESLPLGTTIDGVSVYILDDQLNRVATGVSGEIAFSGLGLAVGYHGDAEFTAKKFTQLQGMGRVFLSGDTGHLDALGRLHFDGRRDRQVKIRGVRVDCHEIEHQINALPESAHSLVFAQGELDERYLCAVVQKSSSKQAFESFDKSALVKRLQSILPVHQIPDRYLIVDALPLLPNGKPDRHAAAELFHVTNSKPQQFMSSKTVVVNHDELPRASLSSSDRNASGQKLLLAPMLSIWQDILNNRSFKANDDFFEAGGYSLLAVKLVMRVNKEVLEQYNLEISIGDLLEKRTVSKVVAQLSDELIGDTEIVEDVRLESLGTLQQGTGSYHLFLVPPFGNTGLFFQKFASHVPKSISVHSFDMAVSLKHETLQSLSSMLVDEVLVVQPKGPWVIAAGCLGNILALEMAHQLKGRTGAECDLYLFDSNAPREGPGWKHVSRNRRSGIFHYASILRTEFARDYCRNLIRLKTRQMKARFDSGIRKYLEVQISQSNQFVNYKGLKGSADITFFRSSTYMKKPYIVERWSLLTTGDFTLHDFPNISHEQLLMADSPHWSKIARVVLQSRYLQSMGDSYLTKKADHFIASQAHSTGSKYKLTKSTSDVS